MKKNVLLVVFAAILLAACASNKSTQPSMMAQPDASAAAADAQATLDDPQGKLAKRSVFYPLDAAEVQDADKPLISAHAKYLAAHPHQRVLLEGNCDERGSSEYNLGLGQRRADGVRKLMLAGGASMKQIGTTSFGKEKPKATCHEESCWQENRRTDFVYPK